VRLEVKLAEKWNRKWKLSMLLLKDSGRIYAGKMKDIYTGKRVLLLLTASIFCLWRIFQNDSILNTPEINLPWVTQPFF